MKLKKLLGIVAVAGFVTVLSSCTHTKCAAYSSNYEISNDDAVNDISFVVEKTSDKI